MDGKKVAEQEATAELNMKLVETLLKLKNAEAERDNYRAEALELRERMGKIRRLLESYERAGAK